MSSWRDPVGPKAKSVYVRRRILVLLGLVAVVAAVVLIIVKPGSGGGASPVSNVEVPAGVDDPAQADGSDAPDAVPDCREDRIEVSPVTDRESYAAGEEPRFSLSVTNTGKRSCAADLGTAGMLFEVTSGSDRVWRSSDCQRGGDHRSVILEPGAKLTTEPVVWDRTRSGADTCDIDREPVTAGGASYHLRVSAAGVRSADTAQFLLS